MEEDANDLVSVVERFQDHVEGFLRDGRLFLYGRDLARRALLTRRPGRAAARSIP